MATIDNNTKLKQIQYDISSFDLQAKKDQSVTGTQLDKILKDIDSLDKSSLDATKVDKMKSDVLAIQAIVNGEEKGTDKTNKAWKDGIDDINALFGELGVAPSLSATAEGHGAGTAYKYLDAAQAEAAGLPKNIAELQLNQQVNQITIGTGDAAKKYYVTSGNDDPSKYTLFDGEGKQVGDPIQSPAAIGLNDGKTWLATSLKGIAGAWTTTDTASLSKDTHLFDFNGATDGKLSDRGLNTAGKSSTTTGGGDVQLGKKEIEPRDMTKTHTYIGSKTDAGTVYADVWSKDPNGLGKDHNAKIKNEKGQDITPDELKNGDHGVFEYTNGAKYVSMSPDNVKDIDGKDTSGYFMITDGKAYDMFTNKEVKMDAVKAYADKPDRKFDQKTVEKQRDDQKNKAQAAAEAVPTNYAAG